MERVFISPAKYVQGKGIVQESGTYIKEYGTNVLILTDEFVWQLVGEKYAQQLTNEAFNVSHILFNGETSEAEIQRINQRLMEKEVQVLVALGGGKVIDTGKSIANQEQIPVVIIPTTASTDAPTSSISVLYEEDGRFKKYQFYRKSPDLILVDTEIIVNAPARLLAAGIADGLSTAIEARAVWKKQGQNVLGKAPTLTSLAIAEKCEEVLFSYGLQAIEDNKKKQVTAAFEAVVEANTLMSGIGFESGGLAAAHALHNGFSAIHGKVDQLMHGEKVAFTTLVQLILEKQSDETLLRYINFYKQLEMPTTCEEMGIDLNNEGELRKIAEQSLVVGDSLQQMPKQVTAEDIIEGIHTLDRFVKTNFA